MLSITMPAKHPEKGDGTWLAKRNKLEISSLWGFALNGYSSLLSCLLSQCCYDAFLFCLQTILPFLILLFSGVISRGSAPKLFVFILLFKVHSSCFPCLVSYCYDEFPLCYVTIARNFYVSIFNSMGVVATRPHPLNDIVRRVP